jgi:hypothetical protein
MTTDDEIVLALEPTTIAEWDVRDLIVGDGSPGLALATREEAAQLLDDVALSVPRRSPVRDLGGYAAQHGLELSQSALADSRRYDFRLMELPVSISVPAGRTLTRLRLGLDAETGAEEIPPVAYDVFPADGDGPAAGGGELAADVSRTLTFACPPGSGALGLDLTAPGQRAGQQVSVRWAQRLTNPVTWDVSGERIGGQLAVYVIWRTPRGHSLNVRASVLGELHGTESPEPGGPQEAGHGRRRKAQFRSASQRYTISS